MSDQSTAVIAALRAPYPPGSAQHVLRKAADEIERLRLLLAQIEKLANEGRDDAIDNRGHVIDLTEADQFEAIAVLARSALGDE